MAFLWPHTSCRQRPSAPLTLLQVMAMTDFLVFKDLSRSMLGQRIQLVTSGGRLALARNGHRVVVSVKCIVFSGPAKPGA